MAKRKHTEAGLKSALAKACAHRDDPSKTFQARAKAGRLAERLTRQLAAELQRLRTALRPASSSVHHKPKRKRAKK